MNTQWQNEMLQKEFVEGEAPKELDGFYHGTLVKILPATPQELFGKLLLQFWVPWKGKTFDSQTQSGDNVVPSYLSIPAQYFFKESIVTNKNELRIFPFKTKLTKGLLDNITVLQLDYNLPENPPKVRDIIDELVTTKKDTYLGKAHRKIGNHLRTVAFFRLRK